MPALLEAFFSQTAPQQQPSLMNPLFLMLALLAVFYLIVWRPQAKERKKVADFLQAIQKGDEVYTNSGLIGRIVLVEPRTVTLDLGGGNKVRLVRSALAGKWEEKPLQEAVKTEAKK